MNPRAPEDHSLLPWLLSCLAACLVCLILTGLAGWLTAAYLTAYLAGGLAGWLVVYLLGWLPGWVLALLRGRPPEYRSSWLAAVGGGGLPVRLVVSMALTDCCCC